MRRCVLYKEVGLGGEKASFDSSLSSSASSNARVSLNVTGISQQLIQPQTLLAFDFFSLLRLCQGQLITSRLLRITNVKTVADHDRMIPGFPIQRLE